MANESLRRTDDLLSELIEIVETARAVPMSVSCVLPRERVLDLLDELREVLPPEMEAARTVIAQRDTMMKAAHEDAADARSRAVAEADAVLADAAHRAQQVLADAEQSSTETLEAARTEHARLVSSTAVHQGAAQAASALREDAERYQQQIAAEAHQYDAHIRGEANRYAHDARTDAERYATKLTADAEDYAERTLDELAAVLHRSALTAEQGRSSLAERRAAHWTSAAPDSSTPDSKGSGTGRGGSDGPAHEAETDGWSSISA
jgi:cell division septum initiation protein DivIVA